MKIIVCVVGIGSVAAFAAVPELHSSMMAAVAVAALFVGSLVFATR